MRHTSLLAILSITGCAPVGEVVPEPEPGEARGHVKDWTSLRVVTGMGDRASDALGVPLDLIASRADEDKPVGDWNYNVGGAISGGVAVYSASFNGPTCSDRLLVPVQTSGADNLWMFDNLYPGCVDSTADTRCSPSPQNHCPRMVWKRTLNGSVQGGAVALNLSGTRGYVATTAGYLYIFDPATGADVAPPFNANTAIGTTSANFYYSSPWVQFSGGENVYVIARYQSNTRSRLFKLSPTGTVLYSTNVQVGATHYRVDSSPVVWNGSIYFGAESGRVFRYNDTGTALTLASGWPVNTTNTNIWGTPSIDTLTNTLFITVGDRLYAVNIATRATQWRAISSYGGTQTSPSSPFIDWTARVVFSGNEGRLWRTRYNADGTFMNGGGTHISATVRSQRFIDDPYSSPLMFNPAGTKYVYLGDSGGYLNRWTADTLSNRQTFPAGNQGLPAAIDSPILVDYLNGNIYFGTTDWDNQPDHRLYQIGQVSLQ